MSQTPQHFYEFGEFRFDTDKRVLWCEGDIVALTPKACEVLLLLLRNHGNLVERKEIIERVWSDTFVEEGNLNHAVSALRRALGNDMIQTVPRKGYRFTADVFELPKGGQEFLLEKRTSSTTLIAEQEVMVNDTATATSGQSSSALYDRRYLSVLGAVVALTLSIGLWFFVAPRTDGLASDKGGIKSLAVLPLKSFSRDGSDEELRLRITDALITRLGQIDELAVRPTNSVLRFAGEEQDISNAGRSLRVDAVLDGRVQEENGQLRVTLQLISVSTGEQLWSDQFDGRVGEILPLQDAISGRLMSTLQRSASDQSLRAITLDSRAYEAYLKGRYFWNQRTPDNYSKAINHFQEAIRLDPDFALAYSGLADSYVLFNRRLDDDPAAIMRHAEDAARRGLELSDRLAETHTSMAVVLCSFRRDWKRSNEHFLRAIELNPRYAIARAWYGLNLISLGRFYEAEQQLEDARRLDPTSRNIAVYSIVNFYHSRNYDAAIEQGKAAIELDPQLSTAYMYMSQAYEQRGMFAEAVETELERYKSISPDEVDGLRAAFERSGIRGFWQKQIEVKNRKYSQGVNCRLELATRHAMLGDVDNALSVIEDNFRFGGTCWNGIANEPAFDGLRSHPRFQAVMREMGFVT